MQWILLLNIKYVHSIQPQNHTQNSQMTREPAVEGKIFAGLPALNHGDGNPSFGRGKVGGLMAVAFLLLLIDDEN